MDYPSYPPAKQDQGPPTLGRVGARPLTLTERLQRHRRIDEDYDVDEDTFSRGRAETERAFSRPSVLPVRSDGYKGAERPYPKPELRAPRRWKPMQRPDRAPRSTDLIESSTSSLSNDDFNGIADTENDRSTSIKPVLSGLQMFAEKNKRLQPEKEDTPAETQELSSFAPLSGATRLKSDLTLPHNFDHFTEEGKEIIVQHEIAKERKRDLEAIKEVFWHVAKLLCFRDRELSDRTMNTETSELKEIGKFLALVLDQEKPGKMRRKRFLDIRGNVRRRIDKAAEHCQEPTDVAIMAEMRTTFRQEHIDLVASELPKISEQIEHWGFLRGTVKEKRKNAFRSASRKETQASSTKRQVHFEDDEDRLEAATPPPLSPRAPKSSKARKSHSHHGSATENRRQAQFRQKDRLEERLRAQLKLFESASPEEVANIQEKVADTQAELEIIRQNEDSESEEDNGAEFVFGAGQRHLRQDHPHQDIGEINRLEDARQREAGTHETQRAGENDVQEPGQFKRRQAYDPELLRRMQLRKSQQLEASKDPEIITENSSAAESDAESEANATVEQSTDDDEEDPEDRQLFRYKIWATFKGFQDHIDADHYYSQSTYDLEKANDTVREIISNAKSETPRDQNINTSEVSLVARFSNGMVNQRLEIGLNAEIEAYAWIERQLVDLDKKRFRDAKRRGVVVDSATYTIAWERIITPIVDDDEAAGPGEPKNPKTLRPLSPSLEGYETLFDPTPTPSPEPTSPFPTPTITRISQSEIEANMYTCSILANRKAKDIYLTWLANFFPSEEYLRLEDDALEQYLETLGGGDMFSRADYFVRTEEGDGRRRIG